MFVDLELAWMQSEVDLVPRQTLIMNAHKYANLPDIDSAPDIYETPDAFSSAAAERAESSDEESGHPSRARKNGGGAGLPSEELDTTSAMSPQEASKRFRRNERTKETQHRALYTYPMSPTSPSTSHHQGSLSQRLDTLRLELAAVEAEFADPANPLLNSGEADPGEMIRDLVDIRARLDKLSSRKEARERLIDLVVNQQTNEPPVNDAKIVQSDVSSLTGGKDLAVMDQRVGDLEKLIGSASTFLDESSPLPPPLLPLLTRLNAQLTLLTQPRHIDSISRRLKLLLSDLERTGNPSNTAAGSSRRQPSQSAPATASAPPSSLQTDILPLLTRLSPHLSTLPHILARLRTLSALHTSAASFQATLETLEEEQKKVRVGLVDLSKAVSGVETSFAQNDALTSRNIEGLEARIETLSGRLEAVTT